MFIGLRDDTGDGMVYVNFNKVSLFTCYTTLEEDKDSFPYRIHFYEKGSKETSFSLWFKTIGGRGLVLQRIEKLLNIAGS